MNPAWTVSVGELIVALSIGAWLGWLLKRAIEEREARRALDRETALRRLGVVAIRRASPAQQTRAKWN